MCRENGNKEPFLHKWDYIMKIPLTLLCKNIDKLDARIGANSQKVCLKS